MTTEKKTRSAETPTGAPGEKNVSLAYRLYGLFCVLLGAYTLFAVVVFGALMLWALQTDPSLIIVGTDPTLPVVLLALSCALTFVDGVALIVFGRSLRKSRRRNAARWSHVLIATSVVQILLKIMVQGVDTTLVPDAVQLLLLIAVSVTVDPSLREERALRRHVRDMVEREAAEEGLLGRDVEGKGYIELNFFNLFWVFVICCVLGLVIETIYHFVVVVPGEIQDRAGLLFGPFSPIYGFGAVLMTVALNRFYKANPAIIFVVSAVIGGLFETATSLFMEFGLAPWPGTTRAPRSSGSSPTRSRSSLAGVPPRSSCACGACSLCLDQALPAVDAAPDQPDPVEDPLLVHRALRRPHAGERRHDARGAGLLVRAALRHPADHARRAVLRRAL